MSGSSRHLSPGILHFCNRCTKHWTCFLHAGCSGIVNSISLCPACYAEIQSILKARANNEPGAFDL